MSGITSKRLPEGRDTQLLRALETIKEEMAALSMP